MNIKRLFPDAVTVFILPPDYETLRALRFKDPYGGEKAVNAYLPSLNEYISICKRYDKQAVLELKK